MVLEKLLLSPQFQLPKTFGLDSDLKSKIETWLTDYYNTLNSSPDLLNGLSSSFVTYNSDSYKQQLQLIKTGLIDSLFAYLNGHPAKAYGLLKETIEEGKLSDILKGTRIKGVKRFSSFYRIRKDNIGRPALPLDLFHIPFQLRHRVSSQRYSIPGFPCLYAGNSLSVAWLELQKPPLIDVKAMRLSNQRNLTILDLSPTNIEDVINHRDKQPKVAHQPFNAVIYDYGLLWPLLAIAHLKINYGSNSTPTFKIEYVITQMLLQWYRDNMPTLDGIRYFSANSSSADSILSSDLYNYVFPVHTCPNTGYCKTLMTLFQSTPISYGLKYNFKIYKSSYSLNEVNSSLDKAVLAKL